MFGMALAFSNSPREAVAAMEASAAGGGAEAATWLQKNTVVRSQTTVHYVAAGQPIVAGGVVKIGMLGIEDSKGNLSAVTERLATAIGQRSTHFAVVPYATLDKQKSRFGVRQLDPSKQEVLTALARAFDIKFVVSGLVSGSQRLRLTVTQTTPYRILHTQEYQNSSTSTAVEDALLYFTKGVVPVYALEDRREMRR
jgi:hypothetical protein